MCRIGRWRLSGASLLFFLYILNSSTFGRRAWATPLLRDHLSSVDQWSAQEEGEDDELALASDTVTRIEEIRKTVETVKQLRLMLNERILANNYNSDDTDESESDMVKEKDGDSNFVVMARAGGRNSEDDRFVLRKRGELDKENRNGNGNISRTMRHRMRKEERQKERRQRQRIRALARNQRKLEEGEEEVELERPMSDDPFRNQLQGFQFNANVQKSMTGKVNSIRKGQTQRQQDPQRFLATLMKPDRECPKLHGQASQVLCPSRRRHGYRVCIPDTALCNGRADCPNGEDEDPVNCLFYKTTIHHFRLVVDAVVQLSDIVKKHDNMHGMDEL